MQDITRRTFFQRVVDIIQYLTCSRVTRTANEWFTYQLRVVNGQERTRHLSACAASRRWIVVVERRGKYLLIARHGSQWYDFAVLVSIESTE